MKRRLAQLSGHFRQQQQFAEDYSPLYAALFGTVADWLVEHPRDPVVKWLLRATMNRAAFDVSNLIAAGTHYEVLKGGDDVFALAAYYPTVGGDASPQFLFMASADGEPKKPSDRFVKALRRAILARQNTLEHFIQTNNVQTNETGRGISWLLPVCLAHLKKVHLVDLGASAGLNLVADQRSFHLVNAADGSFLLKVGHEKQQQFIVNTSNDGDAPLGMGCELPGILSRTGCDIYPFRLESATDEMILASFIWADQTDRIKRLREGIAAYHQVQRSAVPVRLCSVNLPEALPAFLEKQQKQPEEPLIIYNSYIKMYLPDKGEQLRDLISKWAESQRRPIVWIQWEPPKFTAHPCDVAPHYGWLAWTADVWHNSEHHQFQLGWVHPHGHQMQLLPGIKAWFSYWAG